MTLTTTIVTESDILAEFDEKLRTYVQSQTNWIGSTVLWSGGSGGTRTVAYFTGQSNNNTHVGPAAGSLKPDISAVASQTNSLRKVILDYMTIYSNTRKVRVNNTGNIGASSATGIFRFTAGTSSNANVVSGTTTRLNSNAVISGNRILRSDIQTLIDSLQTLWISECFTPVNVTYSHSYCHSSCHSSRARR
jgi:hypothetical protein